MSIKRLFACSSLFLAILFSLASPAAAATYTYTGNDFAFASGLYTTNMSVDLSVTLSITLGSNLNDFDALSSITSFIATDGVQVITEASLLTFQSFRVNTNASGDITGWAWFSAMGSAITDDAIISCATVPYDANCQAIFGGPADRGRMQSWPANPNSYAGTSQLGTWTTVVPEPSTALLLGLGLAGLAWRGGANRAG